MVIDVCTQKFALQNLGRVQSERRKLRVFHLSTDGKNFKNAR